MEKFIIFQVETFVKFILSVIKRCFYLYRVPILFSVLELLYTRIRHANMSQVLTSRLRVE